MARSLLALCLTAGPLLVNGQAGNLLQKASLASATSDRRLQSTTCNNGVDPLLWRATKGDVEMYVLGSHHVLLQDIEPVPDPVIQALGCADVAYFNLACSKDDMGHYFNHCKEYPIGEAQDSIASRLPAQDLANLQAGLQQLAAGAPSTCAQAATTLSQLSQNLNNTNSHITLRALFQKALEAVNPTTCTLDSGAESYEDVLRATFGETRPSFGLQDVSVPCAMDQGATTSQDVALARKMSEHMLNAAWVQQVVQQEGAMAEVMKCGDLSNLKMMEGLPWLRIDQAVAKNPELVTSIQQAQEKHAGKTLIVVVNVDHLVNTTGSNSLQQLLQSQGGYSVDRITGSTALTCTASTYAAPGAKQQNRCLMPPDKEQPASCNAFISKVKSIVNVGPEPHLYHRTKNMAGCASCVNSTVNCACDIEWQNTSQFEDLCTTTEVDSVTGRVFDMDLTRNPGSVRQGPQYAEKKIANLFQNCYATSCDIPLLQEMALRNWYKSDPSLTDGVVTLHMPGQSGTAGASAMPSMGVFSESVDFPSPTGEKWPLWAWLLLAAGVVAVIAMFVTCFMSPKHGKQKMTRGAALDSQPMMGGNSYNAPSFGDTWQRPPSPQSQSFQRHHSPPDRGQPPFPQARGAVPPTQQVHDNTILQQAMQMKHRLEGAGNQAVHQMQSQVLQGMQMPNMGPPMTQQAMGTAPMQPMPMQGNPYYAANMNTQVFGGQPMGSQMYAPLAQGEQMRPMSTIGGMGGYGGLGMGH